MSFAADVKNELCKAEHSRKQLELLSKGAAYAMTEDGEGCFFNTENKRVADSIADAFDSVGKEYSTGESTFRGRTLYTVTLADKSYAYPMPDCSGDFRLALASPIKNSGSVTARCRAFSLR